MSLAWTIAVATWAAKDGLEASLEYSNEHQTNYKTVCDESHELFTPSVYKNSRGFIFQLVPQLRAFKFTLEVPQQNEGLCVFCVIWVFAERFLQSRFLVAE